MTGPNLAVARQSRPHQARGPAAGPPVRLNKPIAPLIDAMLLAGGHTMRGIVRELRRKASAACRGKDLKANIRARLYWLRRKGRVVYSPSRTMQRQSLEGPSGQLVAKLSGDIPTTRR